MKKFLSLIAAFVVVFGMSMPSYAIPVKKVIATATVTPMLDLTYWTEKMDPNTKDASGNDAVVSVDTAMPFGTLTELKDPKDPTGNTGFGVYTSAFYHRVMLVAKTSGRKYKITQKCDTTDPDLQKALIATPYTSDALVMQKKDATTGAVLDTYVNFSNSNFPNAKPLWTSPLASQYTVAAPTVAYNGGADLDVFTSPATGDTGILAVAFGFYDGNVDANKNPISTSSGAAINGNPSPMIVGKATTGIKTAVLTYTLTVVS